MNLYEALELDRDASQDEIRKAYRKRALQTHPDKLPSDVPEDQKQSAHEKFVTVNHAYEVLMEPESRQLYDHFGVWPPPADKQGIKPDDGRHRYEEHAEDAFESSGVCYSSGFSGGRSTDFAFADPFELFDKIMNSFNMRSQVVSPSHTLSSTPMFLFGPRATSPAQPLDPFMSFNAPFSPFFSSPRSPFGSEMLESQRRPYGINRSSRSSYETFDLSIIVLRSTRT